MRAAAIPRRTIAEVLDKVVERARRDHARSMELRRRDYGQSEEAFNRHREICRGQLKGCSRKAHGWCVDFAGTPEDLVRAGLALPAWFKNEPECRRVCVGGRYVELYRPLEGKPEYELTIWYNPGDIVNQT